MKKISKLFVLAIASMVALASCQKVNEAESAFQPKVLKAVFDDGLSKTTLAENFQILWSSDDAITAFANRINYSSTKIEVSENELEAEFTFGTVPAGTELSYALFPADEDAEISNIGVISTTLPVVQNAVAGSFDPKANIALADARVETLKFYNAAGLLAFTIKNDNITKVELEGSPYGFPLVGPAILAFSEGYPLMRATDSSDARKVTLQGNFEKGKTYYAVVFAKSYQSLKLVFTRKDGKTATYTNNSTLTVARNSVTSIWNTEIADSKWEGGELKPVEHTISWDSDADWATDETTKDFSLTTEPYGYSVVLKKQTGSTAPTVNTSFNDCRLYAKGTATISNSKEITKIVFNISSQGLKRLAPITASVGTIATQTSGDETVVWTGKAKEVTFTVGEKADYGSDGNTKAGQLCFDSIDATYLSDDKPEPEPTKYSINIADGIVGGTISASPVKAAEGATVTLTATPATGYEFESWTVTNASTSAAITVSEDNKFTMPAANVNVSATFKEKEVEALKTMDEIFAAATAAGATATDAKITFNNWVISGVKGSNAYVTDGTKGFIIYASGHGFEVGDVLSGTANCMVQIYKASAELTALTKTTSGLTVTKGGVITPATIDIADLGGVNTGAIITFEELTYNGSAFTDGTNTIKPYNTFITLPTLVSGKKYSVKGVFIQYNADKEIAPRTADDIVEKAAPKYAVTVATGIANGTVTVDFSEATEGQTVTITATPASGYKVKSVSAKKASGAAVTVNNNKFTMPAEAVTVSAEFEENKDPKTDKEATISFGTNKVIINAATVTGNDDKGNTWTITTVGTTSFTANADYYQVGSSNKPATSITFTTTLPSDAEITSISSKFGGFNGTAGTVTLKVGESSVGTGSLNAANDVTVSSTSTASGNKVTVTVTGIAKGVKVYNIVVDYKSAN